jgi:hypothetical protein
MYSRLAKENNYAGLEVIITLNMKITIFWNVTPCLRRNLFSVSRGILPPSSVSNSEKSNKEETRNMQSSTSMASYSSR